MGHVRDRMDADLRLVGHAESTRTRYINCAKRYVKHFMRPPAEMGEAEVRKFMLHLTEDRRLAVGTRLQYLGAIKFLYRVTLERPEEVGAIPWPRRKRRDPIVPTREEVERLLDATTSNPYWRAFFLTAYASGLRRMEVVALRAEHIDSRSGLIRVEHGKGDKARQVRLDPHLLGALRDHWRQRRLPGPWLFPTPDPRGGWRDQPISRSAATAAFRRFADAAGLRRSLSLHSLRHAYATHLLEDGVNLRKLQVLLGHRRIETTAQYTRVRTDAIRATPSLLQKLRL